MRTLWTFLLAAAALAGCRQPAPEPSVASDAAEPVRATRPSPPADRPGTRPAGDVMATVNGEPIYMSELEDVLVRDYGMSVAQQLVANELVRQAARARGVTVTQADLERQHEAMLERAFGQVDSAAQREKLLDQVLAQNRISEGVWRLILRRQAMLTKLGAKEVEITEDELRQAFGSEYGRKVVVRHIQTASLPDAQDVLQRLEAGADFAELAAKESTNASGRDGGLLPPIGRDTENVPPAIRSAALAMSEVGEVSEPVQAGTAFHILKLERVIPPQDATFEEVRDELAGDLRRRQGRAEGQRIFHRLMTKAQRSGAIRFVNPILKDQADKARQEVGEPLP